MSVGEEIHEEAVDLLEMAWAIIANTGEGDWYSQPLAWRVAANQWRDRYHVLLDKRQELMDHERG